MDNSIKITGMVLAVVLVISLFGFYVFTNSSAKETIQAEGIASVSVVPDEVSIYFNVLTNGTTAKEAKDSNSEIIEKVIAGLVSEGFERKDIETMNFNVYEDWDWTEKGRVSKGYRASHSLRVKFSTKDIDKIGKAIDTGIDSGAMLSYINFELSQEIENKYKAEVLRRATEDSQIKAKAMAQGLGAKLGKIVSISTSEFSYYPWRAYESIGMDYAKGEEIATNIQPSEREISGRVSVIYKIK